MVDPLKIVDHTHDHPQFNFERDFYRLWGNIISKDLLRWCAYSITLNDPAHDLNHVFGVCVNGKEIFEQYREVYGLNDLDEIVVAHACLMHDLGCRYNRVDHHLIGYGLVYQLLETHCGDMYHKDIVRHIATCVLEHRSSNKNKPSSILSEIVSIADTGKPDLYHYLDRALKFRLSGKEGVFETLDALFDATLNHIVEKFGDDGHHWKSYPEIGLNYYVDEWGIFKAQLNNREENLLYLKTKSSEFINEKWNVHKDLR